MPNTLDRSIYVSACSQPPFPAGGKSHIHRKVTFRFDIQIRCKRSLKWNTMGVDVSIYNNRIKYVSAVEICRRHGEAAWLRMGRSWFMMWSNTVQSYCARTVDGRKRSRRRVCDEKMFENQGMMSLLLVRYITPTVGTHIRILRTTFDKRFRKI